jgi:predicted RecA/RadA family phage recombinase
MVNKVYERLATFQVLQPAGIAIVSGNPYLFGTLPGVAATAQVASGTPPAYDSGDGYFTLDCEGVFSLPVLASTAITPISGVAVARGDKIYYDGGTKDANSGVTYGGTLDKNSSGVLFGLALDPVVSGQTTTIRVLVRNTF